MLLYRKVLTINALLLVFMLKTAAFGAPFSEKNGSQERCAWLCQHSVAALIDHESVVSLPGDKPKGKKPKGASGKKVTFETFDDNYNKARDYYNRQLYISAARIFEELYPLSMGTPYADTILFLFADCYYQNHDYEMAAFHYKEYANRYTGSPRAEEAHYNAIKAIAQLSPDYSLDQTETYYAIEEINVFLKRFPNSSYIPECNALMDELREKLALKSFEILKLYYNTENYKAAQISAQNFFKKYSSSQYADDAYAILVKNNYEFATKSVESKKVERYTACIDAFNSMKANCPYSRLLPEARKLAEDAAAKINRINNKQESKSSKRRNNED